MHHLLRASHALLAQRDETKQWQWIRRSRHQRVAPVDIRVEVVDIERATSREYANSAVGVWNIFVIFRFEHSSPSGTRQKNINSSSRCFYLFNCRVYTSVLFLLLLLLRLFFFLTSFYFLTSICLSSCLFSFLVEWIYVCPPFLTFLLLFLISLWCFLHTYIIILDWFFLFPYIKLFLIDVHHIGVSNLSFTLLSLLIFCSNCYSTNPHFRSILSVDQSDELLSNMIWYNNISFLSIKCKQISSI